MSPAHRAAAVALAAAGLTAVPPAVAQVAPPMLDIGVPERAGEIRVAAQRDDRLKLSTAQGLLGDALQSHGYRPLDIAGCRHSRPRVVVCSIDVALEDSRWEGTGSVRLLRKGGARVRYRITGVESPPA
jgi:hypothetical protein